MATSLTKFKGGRELQAFLNTLPAKVEKNIMRSALRQGANVIKDEAKAQVPVDQGDLEKSIRVSTRSRRGEVKAIVKTDDYKAKWVEFGTAPHFISVKESAKPTRKTRRGARTVSVGTVNKMVKNGSLVIGGDFVGESVAHPGARPNPFMRPAIDSKTNEAIVAVGSQIRKRLTKEGLNVPDALGVDDE